MKLISKSGNYRVVLRHGMPAEPLTGRNAVPGLYILFKDGQANVTDDNTEVIELVQKHPKFGSEFVLAAENGIDPYNQTRVNSEPEHKIINIKHGSVEGAINAKPKLNLPPEKLKEIDDLVAERAIKMASLMAKQMVKEILIDMNKNKTGAKKLGRPKKNNVEEPVPASDNIAEENK